MMKLTLKILAILLITSCIDGQKLKDIANVNAIIEKVANKYGCKVQSKVVLTDSESNPLDLTILSTIHYDAMPGGVLLDTYSELAIKNVYYDTYSITSKSIGLSLTFSKDEIQQIFKCRSVAEKFFIALTQQNMSSIEGDIDSNVVNFPDIEVMDSLSRFLTNKEVDLIGFTISEEKGQKLCVYEANIGGFNSKVTINITVSNCKISKVEI
jgi:hypothetical protein